MINIQLLRDLSNVCQFKQGSTIIREGEEGEEMYILLRGSAAVYKNYRTENEMLIYMISPGSFFGELNLFLNKTRTTTVVALENAILLSINRVNSIKFFHNEPEAPFRSWKLFANA